MVKRRAYFIDADYLIKKNETYVRLLVKGKKTTRLYLREDPYFYVDAPEAKLKDLEKIMGRSKTGETVIPLKVEITKKILFGEEKNLIKVYCKKPPDVPVLREVIPYTCYEHRIPFAKRFIIDRQLTPFSIITYEREGKIIKKITKIEENKPPELSCLAFDIETYNPLGAPREGKDPAIMISYYSPEKEGVLTYKKINKKFVKTVEDEKTMISDFVDLVKDLNPDLIFGYNSANFDLPYLNARAQLFRIPFFLGRSKRPIKKIKKGLISGVGIDGRIHLDAYPAARFFGFIGLIKARSFTLETIYHEITGKSKRMVKRLNIWEIWDKNELDELAEYSLMDSKATYEVGQFVMPLQIELSSITKMPLFDVSLSTSGQLVESLLMFNAFKRNEIVPSKPSDVAVKERERNPIQGAFVKLPAPGIYENIAVLDFRGLYPSIIISYNIDPFTIVKSDGYNSPTGTRFSKKKKGIIPETLDFLVDYRTKIKHQLKKLDKDSEEYKRLNARQWGLKILANSFYGYLAYPRSRWYNRECGESTTAWGRKHIEEAIQKAENVGFSVLYGDSLPYDRKIFITNKKGIIELVKIGDFVRKNMDNKNVSDFKTLSYDGTKLTFKPILRVIEHDYDQQKKGKLLEFITTRGKTIVTPQHSVYSFDEIKKELVLVDAKQLKVGDNLISLTNLPILETYKSGLQIDILDLDFGPYRDQLRVYGDKLKFPADLKDKCPYCGKILRLYSHISLKHSDRKIWLRDAKKSNHNLIGGLNAKIGRIPRFWKLDEELAWIMGYYAAEGSASERSEKHDKLMVSFGSLDEKVILRVKKYFDNILNEELQIIEDFDKRINKKMYYYRIQRLPLVALFKYGFDLGNKSSGKKVPALIYSAEQKLRKAFIEGYLKGDGNTAHDKRYKTHFIEFTTKSNDLAIGLQFLLKSFRYGKTSQGTDVKHISWLYRKDKPGVQKLRLQGIKQELQDFENFCLARIKEINEVDGEESVFDLEVEGTHNFVDAEGLILVHNTDSVFLVMGETKTKQDVLKFMEKVNKELPEKMELELEGFYSRGVFVSKKGGEEKGAKKKYALMGEDGRIKIRGFELVRRDWSAIAKETQLKVLEAILKDGSKEKAIKIVRETIERVRSGKVPLEELAINTQLNKNPAKYEVASPELSAAEKGVKHGIPLEKGSVISFVITKTGKSISEKAEMVEFAKDYDPDYYINHQILPSVLKILKELGTDEHELKFGGKQKSLDSFF